MLDKAGKCRRFRVSPFIDQYLNTKMKNEMKQDSINLVCTQVNQKLKEFRNEYSEQIVKSLNQEEVNQVVEKLKDQIRPYE